jgi:hypothetical protein
MARRSVFCPKWRDHPLSGIAHACCDYYRFPKQAGLKRIQAVAFSCCTAFFGGIVFWRDNDNLVLLFWRGFSYMEAID